jgi:hypothetical protein
LIVFGDEDIEDVGNNECTNDIKPEFDEVWRVVFW